MAAKPQNSMHDGERPSIGGQGEEDLLAQIEQWKAEINDFFASTKRDLLGLMQSADESQYDHGCDAPQTVPGHAPQAVPTHVPQAVPNHAPQSVQSRSPQAVPSHVPEDMPGRDGPRDETAGGTRKLGPVPDASPAADSPDRLANLKRKLAERLQDCRPL
jgi:hypothetical protein